MKRFSRRAAIAIVLASLGVGFAIWHFFPSDERQIRSLIPQAAGCQFDEFMDFHDSDFTNCQSCPLTKLVFLQDFWYSQDMRPDYPGGRGSFINLTLDPSSQTRTTLGNRIRQRFAHVIPWFFSTEPEFTVIHDDHITRFVCVVNGDRATGVILYETLDGVDASVEFAAMRKPNGWQIQEFLLPQMGLRTVLQEDGTWKWEAFPWWKALERERTPGFAARAAAATSTWRVRADIA